MPLPLLEPLTFEDVMDIIELENPDGVLVQFGGQTPLNIAQRRKLAIRMKRLSKSGAFKKKRELSLRRVATGDKLMKRAMKRAKMVLIKKFYGNIDYKNLPISAKMKIDMQLQKKASMIPKIAKKLVRIMRKQEVERVRKLKAGGNK